MLSLPLFLPVPPAMSPRAKMNQPSSTQSQRDPSRIPSPSHPTCPNILAQNHQMLHKQSFHTQAGRSEPCKYSLHFPHHEEQCRWRQDRSLLAGPLLRRGECLPVTQRGTQEESACAR